MVFLPREKSQFILFERTRLKKTKTNRKRGETTKEMEQKQFYKKGWTNEKGGLFLKKKKNKGEFSKKKGINRGSTERE